MANKLLKRAADAAASFLLAVAGAVTDAGVSTDANGTISAKLRGLIILMVDFLTRFPAALGLTTMANSLPVVMASDQLLEAFSIPVTLTVTNGAYTDKDVVGGLITLPGMFSAVNRRSRIDSVVLGGVVPIVYHLWLLTADIATPAADNAAFTLVAADLTLCKGVVDLWSNVWRKAASAFYTVTVDGVGLDVVAGAATTSGYAYLVTDAVTNPGTTELELTVSGEWLD